MAKRREDRWTIRRLREIWDYDPIVGKFIRKEKQRGGAKLSVTGEVGAVMMNGYRVISVDGVHYLAHRLAWAYVHDEWPARFVEHINGDRLDNRIENLRLKWSPKDKDGKVVLTQERLKEVLDYQPETGDFTWKVRSTKADIGDIAGSVGPLGYRIMSVDGYRCLAHRLAWFYVHDAWPKKHIDHINGDKDDNRIANLRDVSMSENAHNTKKLRWSNTTGFPGVTAKRSKFLARITVRNRIIHLGIFHTIAEARIARLLAEKEHFGRFMTWDSERDSVLPVGIQFMSVGVDGGHLYLLGQGYGPIEITDVRDIQMIPVNDEGAVIQ
jgi:HNH endonuclease